MKQRKHTQISFEDGIRGQYASDRLLNNASDANLGSQDTRGDGNIAFHTDGLWDEEDFHNPDEATGRADEIDDQFAETEDMHVLEDAKVLGGLALDSVMGMEDDEAAKWLAEHDN